MLLAFDVGNTNIVLGVFKDGQMIANWRMETDNKKSADEYGMIISQLFKYEGLKMENVKDVIISTVVPSVLYTLQHLSMKYFNRKAMVIGPGIKTGLIVKYDNPKQVGADRIVNAIGAINLYKVPMVIVDFGTATTFCVINENKEYLGGAILPGIKISMGALFEKSFAQTFMMGTAHSCRDRRHRLFATISQEQNLWLLANKIIYTYP